jgi:hypothetical protein
MDTMDMVGTLQRRALVALTAGFLLTGCATHPAGSSARRSAAPTFATVKVQNQSRDRIHVYLIAPRGEWLLGRVEPLQTVWLSLPVGSSAARGGWNSLAVVAGWSRSLQPTREFGSVLSVRQPIGALMTQNWVFTGSQLVPMPQGRRRP